MGVCLCLTDNGDREAPRLLPFWGSESDRKGLLWERRCGCVPLLTVSAEEGGLGLRSSLSTSQRVRPWVVRDGETVQESVLTLEDYRVLSVPSSLLRLPVLPRTGRSQSSRESR